MIIPAWLLYNPQVPSPASIQMNTAAVAKANMIQQQIRPWEVLDQRVLSTLEELDRADFVDENYRGLAYADCQIPLVGGRRMLPPTIEGRLLQALTLDPGDKVLEIGCASGFVTACLARLAKRVTSLEPDAALRELARRNLAASGIDNVELLPGTPEQLPADESWDAIAVTASLEKVPDALCQALNPGGRLFVVVGHSPVMQALLITRVGEREWRTQSLFETDLPRLAG